MLDAHLHLCDDTLYSNAHALVDEAIEQKITQFLCVVTCEEELSRALKLKAQFPCIKIAASTTPHDALLEEDPFFESVANHARKGLIEAIGETGLEYFHPGLNKEYQKAYLIKYVALAVETGLPLIFHCRDAFHSLFALLRPYKGKIKGMIHCFTGNYEEALEAIDLGFLISISGIVTFKNAQGLQQVVEKLPIDTLLIETDSPYLAPLTKRGKVNRPVYIQETYQKVADLKSTSRMSLETQVQANYQNMFIKH